MPGVGCECGRLSNDFANSHPVWLWLFPEFLMTPGRCRLTPVKHPMPPSVPPGVVEFLCEF